MDLGTMSAIKEVDEESKNYIENSELDDASRTDGDQILRTSFQNKVMDTS